MANFRDALSHNVPIVDSSGRPTPEFMAKWQQQSRVNQSIPGALSTPAEVSAVLDILAATPGALLRRGAAQWQALNSLGDPTRFLNGAGAYSLPVPLDGKGELLGSTGTALGALAPGADGQVLTADAAQALGMKWAAGGSGGSSLVSSSPRRANNSTSAYATKGSLIVPLLSLTARYVWASVYGLSAGTYFASIWTATRVSLGVQLCRSAPVVLGAGPATSWTDVLCEVPPATLAAGQMVALLLTWKATPTSALQLSGDTAFPDTTIPFMPDSYFRIASIDPQPGDVNTTSGTAGSPVGLLVTIP